MTVRDARPRDRATPLWSRLRIRAVAVSAVLACSAACASSGSSPPTGAEVEQRLRELRGTWVLNRFESGRIVDALQRARNAGFSRATRTTRAAEVQAFLADTDTLELDVAGGGLVLDWQGQERLVLPLSGEPVQAVQREWEVTARLRWDDGHPVVERSVGPFDLVDRMELSETRGRLTLTRTLHRPGEYTASFEQVYIRAR